MSRYYSMYYWFLLMRAVMHQLISCYCTENQYIGKIYNIGIKDISWSICYNPTCTYQKYSIDPIHYIKIFIKYSFLPSILKNHTLKWFTIFSQPSLGKTSSFKKPCQHLASTLFSVQIHVFYTNAKVQPLDPIISAAPYATKESSWIALNNSTHIRTVTVPLCHSAAVD